VAASLKGVGGNRTGQHFTDGAAFLNIPKIREAITYWLQEF